MGASQTWPLAKKQNTKLNKMLSVYQSKACRPQTHTQLSHQLGLQGQHRTGRDSGSQPPPPKHIPCSSFYPPCPPLPPPHTHPLQQSSHGENSLQAPGSWKEAGRREGVGKEGGRQAHGDTHQTWRPNVHAQEVGQEARGSSLTQEP